MTEAAAAPVRVALIHHVGDMKRIRCESHHLKLGRSRPGSRGGSGGLLPYDKVLVSFATVLIIRNIRALSLTRKSGPGAPAVDVFTPHDSFFPRTSLLRLSSIGHLQSNPELRPLQLALLVLGPRILFQPRKVPRPFRPEFDSIQAGYTYLCLLLSDNHQEDFATAAG